jgi:hypothetical protein
MLVEDNVRRRARVTARIGSEDVTRATIHHHDREPERVRRVDYRPVGPQRDVESGFDARRVAART